jgi:hypothetical protein
VGHAIRISANEHLQLAIEDLLFRSPGRPSRTPLIRYKSFHYQADSWTTPRRVVAKVEHHVGELFPRVGFIVTNLPLPKRIDSWSLTSLQQRLVRTGARLVTHARYWWLLLAESHLTRRLFGSMLQRIWALPVPTG